MPEQNIENTGSVLKKEFKVPNSIKWILYAPVAIFILGMSTMAFDNPAGPNWQLLLVIILTNALPLLFMFGLTSSKEGTKISTKRIFSSVIACALVLGLISALLNKNFSEVIFVVTILTGWAILLFLKKK